MTTIFTDDFAYTGMDISLDEPDIGYKGRQLVFACDDEREFRIKLSDAQLEELLDILILGGYQPEPLMED